MALLTASLVWPPRRCDFFDEVQSRLWLVLPITVDRPHERSPERRLPLDCLCQRVKAETIGTPFAAHREWPSFAANFLAMHSFGGDDEAHVDSLRMRGSSQAGSATRARGPGRSGNYIPRARHGARRLARDHWGLGSLPDVTHMANSGSRSISQNGAKNGIHTSPKSTSHLFAGIGYAVLLRDWSITCRCCSEPAV